MGNCSPKPRQRSAPPARSTAVQLYGSETCPVACRIRAALLYKPAAASAIFVPSDGGPAVIRCGSESATGSVDSMLCFIDAKLGGPPAAVGRAGSAAAVAVALQHRSMERHVAEMARWAEELAAEGSGRAADGKRMGRRYGELMEVMLEHARMEERVLFPALERAADDPGFCRMANEEHGRDLPIMNGIREDIKSMIAIEAGTPFYQEAMLNLARRFRTLQEHCKEHFEAEERELFPLLEAAEKGVRDEPWRPPPLPSSSRPLAGEVIEAMEVMHSKLFVFFMAGLFPKEAMQYIDIVCRCTPDQKRVVGMLQSLIAVGKPAVSWF